LQAQMDASGVVPDDVEKITRLSATTKQALEEKWFLTVAEENQATGIYYFLNQQFDHSVHKFYQAAQLNPTSVVHKRNLEKARSKIPGAVMPSIGGFDDDYCGPLKECMKTISFQSPYETERQKIKVQAEKEISTAKYQVDK